MTRLQKFTQFPFMPKIDTKNFIIDILFVVIRRIESRKVMPLIIFNLNGSHKKKTNKSENLMIIGKLSEKRAIRAAAEEAK